MLNFGRLPPTGPLGYWQSRQGTNVDLIKKPLGVDLLLIKPVNPDELLNFVSALIAE